VDNEIAALLLSSLAVLGVFLLSQFSPCFELHYTPLNEIRPDKINKKIRVLGKIEKASNYKTGSASLILTDDSGKHLKVFVPYYLNSESFRFKKDWCIDVLGMLESYRGAWEIVPENEKDLRIYRC